MFIAEIGINHNGSLDIAMKLIDIAKESGADVVKFQKRNLNKCIPKSQRNVNRDTPWGEMTYFEYKKRLEFGKEEYDKIDEYCKKLDIKWSASVWDIDSLRFITQYDIPFVKIPSACITDIELLKEIKKYSIPVIMSTGMSSKEEVCEAIKAIEGFDLTIMHCNSSYPAAEDELDLNTIKKLKEMFPRYKVGYSGHEEGILPTVIARTLGAEVLERHITLDKNMWGTDQKASLDPKELAELILNLKNAEVWLGKSEIKCYSSEEKVKKKLRREITPLSKYCLQQV